ncbi:hypothetical protein FRC07_006731 [Ceratobasidium sp. 392]|nr:hypothetical protein FRC07_006731 [Ceratobasidium sp. 392]
MNFTWSNSYADDESEGNYQLLSSYEYGLSSKEEEYPYTPVYRKAPRNVLIKSERRRHCSSPSCVFWVSPSTPRSMLPRGMCDCALDSLPTLPRDAGATLRPQDICSALEDLILDSSRKDGHSRTRRSMRTSTRHDSDTPSSGSSSPRSRIPLRLKNPLSGRRAARSERSAILDPEISPSSSASSSRYGSPLARRSPTPFTPRSVDLLAAPPYDAHEFNPNLRVEPAVLDVEMPMAATEATEQDAPEQGASGAKAQDPLIVRRLKMPDSMLGHNARRYSRLP